MLLITLGTGRRRRHRHPGRGAARRARLRCRDRALPGRSRRARCARAGSGVTGRRIASGTALGAMGREWAAAGRRPSVLAAGRRRRSTRSPASTWATPRRRALPDGDRDRRRVRAARGRRAGRAGRTSSIPSWSWCRAAWSSSATCSSTRCAPRSAAASRARRTVPRSRSCPPSSGGHAGVVGAAVLARELVVTRQGRDHVAVVPRRRRYVTGGGGRGRGHGARRRVRLRPPVPARPRRSSAAPRSRCSR